MMPICRLCLLLTEFFFKQCDTFLRLAKESVVHEPVDENIDLETLVAEVDDDKCFAAMSISKTISTVCWLFYFIDRCLLTRVGFFVAGCRFR